MTLRAIIGMAVLFYWAGFAEAASTAISYQGTLTAPNGSPIPNGVYAMRFSLWDLAGGGVEGTNKKWEESWTGGNKVLLAMGSFSAQLGSLAPFPGNFFQTNPSLWLEVAVDLNDNAVFEAGEVYFPRAPFAAAPYAFSSGLSYKNVVVVAKTGGAFDDVQDALDSITDASASNPYLLWIAPGIYNGRVTMKPWVDIQGAGQGVTKLTHVGSATWDAGTVMGASEAEIRDLTVENTGGAAYAFGIYSIEAAPRITRVTAIANGGTTWNFAIDNDTDSAPVISDCTLLIATGHASATHNRAINTQFAAATIKNCTARITGASNWNSAIYNYFTGVLQVSVTDCDLLASGTNNAHGVHSEQSIVSVLRSTVVASGASSANYAVYNSESPATLDGSILTASGSGDVKGVFNIDNNIGAFLVTINHCRITGSSNTIFNDFQFTTRVAGSQLAGGAVVKNGTSVVTGAGNWDENYTFYASTLP